MGVAENLRTIQKDIPTEVCLVAVSKTKPASLILEAYEAGHKVFGENKVQELVGKYEELPKDIQWHFIGHLQTNKVKYLAPFVSLIHGVDSLKLLKTIHKEGIKNKRTLQCLLQVKIAEEESKFGLSPTDIKTLVTSGALEELQGVRIVGLMGMATNTENREQIKAEFDQLKAIFDEIASHYPPSEEFKILSMGMSGDYSLAIASGSTMIRVGSSIFGQRYAH